MAKSTRTDKWYVAFTGIDKEEELASAPTMDEIMEAIENFERVAIYEYDIEYNNIYDGDYLLKSESFLENERLITIIS